MSPVTGGVGVQYARSGSRHGTADTSSDPRAWSEGDLAQWLAVRGLPPDIPRAFEAHLVNGLLAEDLSETDLASMGIADALHQRRVILELRQLFLGGELGACGKSLRSEPSSLVLATPAAPPSFRPPAPPVQTAPRKKARPQSARPHSQQASTQSQHVSIDSMRIDSLLNERLPMKSRLKLDTQTIQKAKCSVDGSGLSGASSPYTHAVPTRARPRSASSANRSSRSREKLAAFGPAPCAEFLSAPVPAPLVPQTLLPEMPATPAVSSTSTPMVVAPQPQRQRTIPPMPCMSVARVGAPPAQAPPLPAGAGNFVQDRDMRLGFRALRASRERLGGQYEVYEATALPPPAPAATSMRGGPSEIAAGERESQECAVGVTGTLDGTSPIQTAPCSTGLDLLESHSEILAKRRALDILETQMRSGISLDRLAQSERGLEEHNNQARDLVASGMPAKGLQSLTLGGHSSVADLLYERDSLAAALAAEKRRSGEFEQLWRRAQQDLQQVTASTASSAATAMESSSVARQDANMAAQLAAVNPLVMQHLVQSVAAELQKPSAGDGRPLPHSPPMLPAITSSTAAELAGHMRPDAKQQIGNAASSPVVRRLHDELRACCDEVAANFAAEVDATEMLTGKVQVVAAGSAGPEAIASPVSNISANLSNNGDHLDNLCNEFRLRVHDMVAAAVGPAFPDSEAALSSQQLAAGYAKVSADGNAKHSFTEP